MGILYPSKTPNVTRTELSRVPTPAGMGRFHRPYPFADYVNDVAESLDRVGLQVVAEEYELAAQNQRFFGVMEVSPVEGEYISAKEWSTLIGIRGSHDQTIQRGLVIGSRVMVCSNLAFSGNVASFNTKQTTYIQHRLPRLINESISRLPELIVQQDAMFASWKDYEFKQSRQGDAALVEIFRQGGLSAAQLGKAIREWDHPTYDEHASHGYSAWRLFNSVTEALKPGGENVNTNLIADRTEITTRFINNVVGLRAAA